MEIKKAMIHLHYLKLIKKQQQLVIKKIKKFKISYKIQKKIFIGKKSKMNLIQRSYGKSHLNSKYD